MKFEDLPAIGQPLDGGLFAGLTTTPEGVHCAVVLLADKPVEDLNWKAAMDWAQSVGGGLPGRPIAAMLFANLKPQFDEAFHWTNETSSLGGACAWGQSFYGGTQSNARKGFEGRARAVRLIPLAVS